MPKTDLTSVPTEDLVQELKRRFAELEKAKADLLGTPGFSETRKNTYTSQSLAQKIRHAKKRNDDPQTIAELEAQKRKLAEERNAKRIRAATGQGQ